MIKLLIGGSPCTFWSVAQRKHRETEPDGMGWELFKNYLLAREKFSPDLFLYENNVSAASAVKQEIRERLAVGGGNTSKLTRHSFHTKSKEILRPQLRRSRTASR